MTGPFPVVPLGAVATQRKAFIEIDDLETYKRCRVQLHAQGIVLRDMVPGAEIKTKRQQVCQAGDFLVAEIDAKVGGFGIVPESLDAAIVSSHYFLFDVDQSKLDIPFLGFWIRTSGFRDQVAAQGSTNYAAIRSSDVLRYTIPLPPLAEQRRIVARIEALAARIAAARGLRESARETLGALQKSALSSICHNLAVLHDMIPLHELTIFIGDMNHEMPRSAENGVPFISPKDFDSNGAIDFVGCKKISAEDFERLSRKCRPQSGDLLMARYGTIGATRLVEYREPFIASYSIAVIRPNQEKADSRFLYWMLTSPFAQAQATAGIRGSGMADLGLKTIRQFRIPMVPRERQHEIVEHLDGLQAQVDAVKRLQAETAAALDALLPAVLDRAFRGAL